MVWGQKVEVRNIMDHRLHDVTLELRQTLSWGDDEADMVPYAIRFRSTKPAPVEIDYSNVDFSLLDNGTGTGSTGTGTGTGNGDTNIPYLDQPPSDKTYYLDSADNKLTFNLGQARSGLSNDELRV